MPASTGKARSLRQAMTNAERRLWSILRGRNLGGFKFRRQHPCGSYVLDFACIERMLALEADGGQHADSEADLRRTKWLESQGWQVLRFWNNDILANTDGVAAVILQALQDRPEGTQPSPGSRCSPPSPMGRG